MDSERREFLERTGLRPRTRSSVDRMDVSKSSSSYSRSRTKTKSIASSTTSYSVESVSTGDAIETTKVVNEYTPLVSTRNSESSLTYTKPSFQELNRVKRQLDLSASSQDDQSELSTSKSMHENGTTLIGRAFAYYKSAGEYWNKYPKTDFTYSSKSKDRREIEPGVIIMPNMSRPGIHSAGNSGSSSPNSFSSSQFLTSTAFTTNRVAHSNHYTGATRRLLRDYDVDEVDYIKTSSTNISQQSIFRRIFTYIWTIISTVYLTITNKVQSILGRSSYDRHYVRSSKMNHQSWLHRSYSAIVHFIQRDVWFLSRFHRSTYNYQDKPMSLLKLFGLLLIPFIFVLGWLLLTGVPITFFESNTNESVTQSTTGIVSDELMNALLNEQRAVRSQLLKVQEDLHEHQEKLLLLANNKENIITKCDCQKDIDRLESELAVLEGQIINLQAASSEIPFETIQSYIVDFLTSIYNSDDNREKYIPNYKMWMNTLKAANAELDAKIANYSAKLVFDSDQMAAHAVHLKETLLEQLKEEMNNQISMINVVESKHSQENLFVSGSPGFCLTTAQVKEIVEGAIAKYDADKTGMVDFALESSGGQIISTRCTENYPSRTAQLLWMGFPLWSPSKTPRTVIQPGVHPGECWAFQGAQGYLVIGLSTLVQIKSFSIEHIPRALSPGGKIDSAPKDFSVWGLEDEHDVDPVKLGQYTYKQNGTSLQFFEVQRANAPSYRIVELRIHSNHGNINYTCLYRFRVHGVPDSK